MLLSSKIHSTLLFPPSHFTATVSLSRPAAFKTLTHRTRSPAIGGSDAGNNNAGGGWNNPLDSSSLCLPHRLCFMLLDWGKELFLQLRR